MFGFKKLQQRLFGSDNDRDDRRREHQRRERTDGGERDAVPESSPAESGGDPDDDPTEVTFDQDEAVERSASSDSDADDDEALDELRYRIESLEAELEDERSQLDAIRDSQERLADRMDDVDETVRRLVGIYDRVTDDVNPFTGEGEDAGGFDIFGEPDLETASRDESKGDFDELTLREGDDSDSSAAGAEETVSFDDLKDAFEDPDGEADSDAETEDRVREFAESESQKTAPAGDATLRTLPDTYATDLIVFEWLTELVRAAGPAAALRAISYYAEIGWISDDVCERLERVLSGPDLDIHVDPSSTPTELTAEDHTTSYSYIRKLREVHEIKQDVRS